MTSSLFRIPSARRLIAVSFFLVVLAVGVLLAGFAWLERLSANESASSLLLGKQMTRLWQEAPGAVAFKGRQRLNILCLGIDYNYTDQGILYTKNARSDTMFILSVDAAAQTMGVLSIPRDTWVFIPSAEAYEKINAAYSYGGSQEARATVSQFLGLQIDYEVLVKVKGAGELVDAVGGLEVDVEKDMDYDDSWGNLHIHLKKGRQVLHGKDAVGYCRFRMDEEGDRGRIRRQQQAMEALMHRLSHPAIVARLPAIVETVRANVETDMTFAEMLDLARLYKDFDPKRMKRGAIEGDDVILGEQWVIQPYGEQNRKVVQEVLSPAPRTAVAISQARVEPGQESPALSLEGAPVAPAQVEEEPRVELLEILLPPSPGS